MRKGIFFLLLLINVIIGLASEEFLYTNDLLFESLEGHAEPQEIQKIISIQEKWEWVGPIYSNLMLVIRILLVSFTLYIGLFFFKKEIKYKDLTEIVVQAEYILVFAGATKFLWFLFKDNYSLQDIQLFFPLSLLNFIGPEGLAPWYIYPFQVLNLFELTYWFALAYLLGKEINISTEKSFGIIASSYGSGLLLWVVIVMFLSLNIL